MTREEAIEKVRRMSLPKETMEILEALAPELRESEDERIRKELIAFFQDELRGDYWHDLEVGHILAWLEKQKEQPKEELVYRLNGFMQEYIKEGKDAAEKEHRFKCYQLFWDALEDENFFEQKEKEIPKWMPKFLDELRSKKHYFDWDEHRDIEGSILAIIDFIAPNYFTEKDKKEQKPVEWSEEDKNRIQRICEFLWKNRKGDTDTIYQIEKDADWLQSLRPDSYKNCSSRWKPSEEQMEALKHYVDTTTDGEIELLYNDLKKLM